MGRPLGDRNPFTCLGIEGWWTRSQRLRTVVTLSIEAPLREMTDPPIYQRIAPEAARFRAAGLSDHAIGLRFRVTDKTAAKAIRWFLARSDGAS